MAHPYHQDGIYVCPLCQDFKSSWLSKVETHIEEVHVDEFSEADRFEEMQQAEVERLAQMAERVRRYCKDQKIISEYRSSFTSSTAPASRGRMTQDDLKFMREVGIKPEVF